MEPIKQPIGSSLCSQCCVAMLLNKPLEAVIAVMGEGRKYPRELRRAFSSFAAFMGERSVESFRPDEIGVVFCKIPRKGEEAATHWLAYSHGVYYDPRDGSTYSEPPLGWLVSRYVVSTR